MSWGLPLLPGYSFYDSTKSKFYIPRKLGFQNGIPVVRDDHRAIGGEPLDADRSTHFNTDDPYTYDPALIYGRVKKESYPIPQPHWVLYDKAFLIFKGYIKRSEDTYGSKRRINLIYFLEDDTLTIVEPYKKNSGLWQGKIVKRNKILKNDSNEYWHWKDLNVGKDINIFGFTYRLTSCDESTRDFLESQGILINSKEDSDEDDGDSYVQTNYHRRNNDVKDLTFRKFLQNDGKILKFNVIQMDEEGSWDFSKQYQLSFYLSDDTLSIVECNSKYNCEITLFPTLLKRTKVPKDWTGITADTPVTHEIQLHERRPDEFYMAHDFILGKEMDILGRKFLLCDCDSFTRNYYKHYLNITQEPPLNLMSNKHEMLQYQPAPPHIGIGDPDDTLMSCFTFHAKPPFKDLVQYNLNDNKHLRYSCELISVQPEDSDRQFVMAYNLSDGTIRIDELPRRNSGIHSGRFSGPSRHLVPGSNEYYNPNMFYIGSIIKINGHRFKINGADLFVYKYMNKHKNKFSSSLMENIHHYFLMQGKLKGTETDEHFSYDDKTATADFESKSHIHHRRESHDLSAPLSGLACAKVLPEASDFLDKPHQSVACLTGVALPLQDATPEKALAEDKAEEDEVDTPAGKPTKMVTFVDSNNH